jgi:hypothetical protein
VSMTRTKSVAVVAGNPRSSSASVSRTATQCKIQIG